MTAFLFTIMLPVYWFNNFVLQWVDEAIFEEDWIKDMRFYECEHICDKGQEVVSFLYHNLDIIWNGSSSAQVKSSIITHAGFESRH